MSRLTSVVVLCSLALFYSTAVSVLTFAQAPGTGSTMVPIPGVGHDYIHAFSETVDPSSGSVSVRIGVPIPKGRGITLPFSFAYDSNGVVYPPSWTFYQATGLASDGGWSYTIPALAADIAQYVPPGTQNKLCQYYTNYRFVDPSGGRRGTGLYKMIAPDTYCPATPTLNGGDIDFRVSNPSYVLAADADGTVYKFPGGAGGFAQSVEDRNGNVIKISGSGTTVTETDTLGRVVLSVSGFGTTGNTVTVAGLGAPYKIAWESVSADFTVDPTLVYNGSNYACSFQGSPTGAISELVVQSIQLPNGKSYSFKHGTDDPNNSNPYGLISQVTYPTGAWVKYSWIINSQSAGGVFPNLQGQPGQCDWRWGKPAIQSRTVSFDGVHTALKQTFQYSTNWGPTGSPQSNLWNTKQTIVTTQDLVLGTSFTTTYLYSPTVGPEPLPYYIHFGDGVTPDTQIPAEQTVTYQDVGGSLLKTVNKTWYNAAQLQSEQDTVGGAASKKTYTYGSGGQLLEEDEYDFGAPSPTRKTVTKYQAFNATSIFTANPSIFDRPCQSLIYDGSGNRYAESDYFYDSGATTTVCGAAGTPSVASAGGSSLTGHDETYYGSSGTSPRGNLTNETVQCFVGTTACTNAITTFAYDETGQVVSKTDPNLNQTSYSYTDAFLDTNSTGFSTTAGAPPAGTVTNAYLSTITLPITGGVSHTQGFSYGYNNGELTQSTDQNQQPTKYKYDDFMSRITEIDYPDGGQTEYTYNDVAPSPSVTTCQNIDGTAGAACSASAPPSGWKTRTAIMDGKGHVVQTQLLSDLLGTDFTDTSYDGEGRVLSRSNPHRSTSLSSDGTTKYVYDALGRPTQTTNADGSIASTAYDQTNPSSTGICTTITDEAGNSRQSCSDGLGRITGVWEDPGTAPHLNYQTKYTYDPLNNLLSVTENGSDSTQARSRSFTYDSLSRLLCSSNPEIKPVTCPTSGTSFPVGAITYSYDANGNITQKKSPLPNQTSTPQVTTNYTYDVLNRLIKKSYTGMTGQPVMRFGYDGVAPSGCTPTSITGATNLIGRRSSMCDGVGSAAWSYDLMGRTFGVQHTIHGITKLFTYLYLYDGEVYSLDYPDGKSVSFSPYGTGLTDGVEDDIFSFQGSHDFAPNGSPYAVDYGPSTNASAASQTFYYNKRFQSAEMYLFDTADLVANYCYDFHVAGGQTVGDVNQFCTFSATSPGDNGNLYQSLNNLDATGNRTANYVYDSLNRIQQAYTTGPKWGEAYVIDAWGNLTNRNTVPGKTNYEPLAAPALATNHLTGFTYDAAGNLIVDGTNTYTYDAENRLITAGGVTYSYDGDGNRVMKSNGTIYWRGSDGETLAESNLSGTISEEYVYINGKREVRMDRPSGAVHLYFTDLVGSTTLITDVNGTPQEQSDYYPFGGEIPISGSDPNHYKFTGKERDAETCAAGVCLDYFGARHHASSMGRFMTPDPLMASATVRAPQTWNRYSYVSNNPLRYVDPTGMIEESAAECQDDNRCVTVKVNVIYDKDANLTDKQKDKFNEQLLQEAKNEYGDAHIHLDVSYTAGGYDDKGYLHGVSKDSLNVFVSDSTPRGDAGASQVTRSGYAVTYIDVNKSDKGTLAHELAHQFAGDTTGVLNSIVRQDPTGIVGMFANTFADLANDTGRALIPINAADPHIGRADPAGLRPDGFNAGARAFQTMLNQQAAIQPRTQ